MKAILRVVSQGTVTSITKNDGTPLFKCPLILQELGNQYEDSYVVTLMGDQTRTQFRKDQLIAASLRFMTHEFNGQHYQDILLQDFHIIS